jgi:hypothetical protein
MRPVNHVQGPPVRSTNVLGGVIVHTVTPPPTLGSTLKGIATIYYGDNRRWADIYNANRRGVTRIDGSIGIVDNPEMLIQGTHIFVP